MLVSEYFTWLLGIIRHMIIIYTVLLNPILVSVAVLVRKVVLTLRPTVSFLLFILAGAVQFSSYHRSSLSLSLFSQPASLSPFPDHRKWPESGRALFLCALRIAALCCVAACIVMECRTEQENKLNQNKKNLRTQ